MKHAAQCFVIFLLMAFAPIPVLAQTPRNSDPSKNKPPGPQAPAGKLDFQTDTFTGSFNYRIPITVPPGRHGSEPELVLAYNSGGGNGWCGVGWSLELGYIERDTRKGVPIKWNTSSPKSPLTQYDDSKGFVFSFGGKSARLVPVGGTEYRAEVDSDYLRFDFDSPNNKWTVTDKGGNKFYFGELENSRMFNANPTWSAVAASATGTFRWAHSSSVTVNGDMTKVTYASKLVDDNVLYPEKIEYNASTSDTPGAIYNSRIEFELETRGETPDLHRSYKSGYLVRPTRRLKNIKVFKNASTKVRRYLLEYQYGPSTKRSRLNRVTTFGSDDTSSLPPITLNYTDKPNAFANPNPSGAFAPSSSGYFNPNISTSNGLEATLADLDGDGIPDRVQINTGIPYSTWKVQRGIGLNGSGGPQFEATQGSWAPASTPANPNDPLWNALNSGYSRLTDINGDGLQDRVMDPTGGTYDRFKVFLNNGTGFGTETDWLGVLTPNPANSSISGVFKCVEQMGKVRMLDMNGDGLPDRVLSGDASGLNGPFSFFYVQFNTGSGFETEFRSYNYGYTYPYWNGLSGAQSNGGLPGASDMWWATDSNAVKIIDINGDELPDRVWMPARTQSGILLGAPSSQYPINDTEPYKGPQGTFYYVQYNNGAGFEGNDYWLNVDPQYSQPQVGMSCSAGTTVVYCTIDDGLKVAMRDVNGDGLPDRLMAPNCSATYDTTLWVQLNTGSGFANKVDYVHGKGGAADDWSVIEGGSFAMLDVDGDGLLDRVGQLASNNYFTVSLGQGDAAGTLPDYLKTVQNGLGGSVAVTYKPSTRFNNRLAGDATSKGLLPFPVQVISTITTSDGFYPAYPAINYDYVGGYYDSTRREFAGFWCVTTTDPLGSKTKQYFHQGGGRDGSGQGEFEDDTRFSKRGFSYRTETYGSDTLLYSVTLNKVAENAVNGTSAKFPYILQTIQLDYPGGGSPRASLQTFSYEFSRLNPTGSSSLGEVTAVNGQFEAYNATDVTAADNVYSFWTYKTFASPDNLNLLNKPERQWVSSDAAGTVVLAETLFDQYDGQTGNLTSKKSRICDGPPTYATESFVYDSYNNLRYYTSPAGVVTETTYDPASNNTFPKNQYVGGTIGGAQGAFVSTFTYDPSSGLLIASTDEKGLRSSTVLDVFFRTKEILVANAPNIEPNVWLTKFTYPASGFVPTSISPLFIEQRQNDTTSSPTDTTTGLFSYTYYDGLGRLVQVRDEAEGTRGFRVSQTVYDARGQVKVTTLPEFRAGSAYVAPNSTPTLTWKGSYHEYDHIGRPSKISSGMDVNFVSGLLNGIPSAIVEPGSLTGPLQMAYADGGSPWARVVIDEKGMIRKFNLDAFGRTNQITDFVSGAIYSNGQISGSIYASSSLGYDRLGRLTKLTDAKNNVVEFAFNDLGQQVAMTDPNLGYWQYQRDNAGRLRTQIDGNGQKITFDYSDVLGRLKTKRVFKADGTLTKTTSYAYDSGTGSFTVYKGQLASVTDSEGSERFSYDVRGRTLNTERSIAKNGQTYTTVTTYDNADRIQALTYPNFGPTITYKYDEGGNLDSVAQGTTTYYDVTGAGFNEQRQINEITFLNGVKTSYTYYPVSKRLSRILTQKGTSPALQDLTYQYDQVGNVMGIGDAVIGSGAASAVLTGLQYDSLHRLKSLTRLAATTWTYDEIGNILTNGEEGADTNNYGAAGKFTPHGVKKIGSTKTYGYDAVGNVTYRNGQVLRYDAENRLASVVSSAGSLQATFGYDDGGTRLWKQPASGYLQVSIGSLYEEKDGKILYHVFAGSRRVATLNSANALVSPTANNDIYYYHPDHLSTTAVLSDKAGLQADHYEHSAYGRERFNDLGNSFALSHRYTGQVLDAETGLYYYGARYYDADLGRFIQADTVIPDSFDPQSWNRYTYALNNPLKYNDPDGHQSITFQIPNGGIGYTFNTGRGPLVTGGQIRVEVSPNSAAGRAWLAAAQRAEMQLRADPVRAAQVAAFRGRVETSVYGRPLEPGETFIGPRGGPTPNLTFTPAPSQRAQRAGASAAEGAPEFLSTDSAPRGSLNPETRAASSRGSTYHADRPGRLPDQLRNMYPETEFRFTPPGKPGQDVEVVGGMHPSAYPYGNWPRGVNRGDFKPGTASGLRTFNRDQKHKWTESTHFLPYNPSNGTLK